MFKVANKKIRTLNESGQGILEYILILVVTVSLIIGLLTQFNKSMQVWLNNYFGEYLSCLLETGELPTLGSTNNPGLCAQFYSPFQANDINSNGGGEPSSSGNQSSTGSSKSSNSESSSARPRGAVNSDGSSSSGKFNRISSFRAARKTSGASSGSSKDSEKSNTGNTNVSTPSGLQSDRNGPRGVRIENKNLNLAFSTQKAFDEEREKKISVAATNDQTSGKKRDERFMASKPTIVSEKDDEDLSLGFGDYLRYILIAAIIIAIVLFFGGQALQLSKSMD